MSSKRGSIVIMLIDFSYHPQIMTGVGFLSIRSRKMHGISFWNSQKLTFS